MTSARPLRIVLVDDDPTVLLALGEMFRSRNHEVLTYDQPTACPVFTQPHGSCFPGSRCPDVIITDYAMAEVNGARFIDAIYKKQCRCENIALLSGVRIPDEDMRRLAKYGTRFFTKPLDFAEFEAWMMLKEKAYI